jgi:hypothetical protein
VRGLTFLTKCSCLLVAVLAMLKVHVLLQVLSSSLVCLSPLAMLMQW